jgi:hypothetical protein
MGVMLDTVQGMIHLFEGVFQLKVTCIEPGKMRPTGPVLGGLNPYRVLRKGPRPAENLIDSNSQ